MLQHQSSHTEIMIASHVAEAHGPQYVLHQYLKERQKEFVFVSCPFDYARTLHAEARIYQHGQEKIINGHRNTSTGVLSWIRDAWFVWRCGWKYLNKATVFIGINNLNVAIGILLKWLGKGGYVVYYVIDYTPRRFSSRLLNWIYQSIARFAAKHADMVWNLSGRMQAVHEKFGAPAKTNILVPIGIDDHEARVVNKKEIKQNEVVVVSTLFESKGVQLILDAITQLPELHLCIIGTGPYQETLQQQTVKLGISKQVEFLGMVDREILFRRLSHSRIAVATYQEDPSNYSYYADPAKPKEYLACGIPTIITRVPWIAEAIDQRPMGIAIDYDKHQLITALKRLIEDDVFWNTCRKNALDFSRNMGWNEIFADAFKAIEVDQSS
ncbi:glycosyltransferase [bacterium]|nr:glycosyltransferase [bacterium]